MQALFGKKGEKGALTREEIAKDRAQAVPWVEKFRPKTLEDVAHQEEVVAVLKKTVKESPLDLPHLLFYGPPGTGKTSTVLAMARDLYGPKLTKQRVLELNASDERGISVIRTKIKNFAQQTAATASKEEAGDYPCPPYKIIVLDEADSMTSDAQSALRRTMEKYSTTTRFCLICNYVSRIIEPLASRCAKFRFKPLSTDSLMDRLRIIAKAEGINASDDALMALIEASEGDMRKGITGMHSASRIASKALTKQSVMESSGRVPDETVEELMHLCLTSTFDRLDRAVKNIIFDGYSGWQTIAQIHDKVVTDTTLNDLQKAHICDAIAKADKCLTDGADEYLQVVACVAAIMGARSIANVA
eukprot:Clim_evm11s159 gene=Clim_evmTU11s159